VLAQNRRGTEAALGGESLDREVRRLEQMLGPPDTRVADPGGRGRAHLLAESTAQRPRAHRSASRDRGQREVPREVLLDPGRQRRQRHLVDSWRGVHDELRLTAGALERHDGGAGHVRGRLGAEIAAHEVETQIESRCRTRGREHGAVVHIQHARIDGDAWISTGELRRAEPMRRCAQAVEHAGRTEQEGARADGRDARASTHRAANRAHNRVGNRSIEIVNPRHDHRARALER